MYFPTQQVQQQAMETDILGITTLNIELYGFLRFFNNGSCLPCNTTICHDSCATVSLWTTTAASELHTSYQKFARLKLIK
jgi:hypothetical protein